MAHKVLSFLSAAMLLSSPAMAERFSFSYQYGTGNVLSGSVEGNLQGDRNTVVNLHDLSAKYSLEPSQMLTFTTQFFDVLKLDAVGIQFAGFEEDTNGSSHADFGFAFIDDGFPCPNCATLGTFDVGSDHLTAPFGANQLEAEAINRAAWSVQITPVPEPTSFVLLGMLSVVAMAALIKQRQ